MQCSTSASRCEVTLDPLDLCVGRAFLCETSEGDSCSVGLSGNTDLWLLVWNGFNDAEAPFVVVGDVDNSVVSLCLEFV